MPTVGAQDARAHSSTAEAHARAHRITAPSIGITLLLVIITIIIMLGIDCIATLCLQLSPPTSPSPQEEDRAQGAGGHALLAGSVAGWIGRGLIGLLPASERG
mmetsp:Transcript_64322/g.134204  ORF Transcript_64322/g.134204 Transcript_64322/m.134204 type:complete len:103 (+) Transcript_64322:253-561(+)